MSHSICAKIIKFNLLGMAEALLKGTSFQNLLVFYTRSILLSA